MRRIVEERAARRRRRGRGDAACALHTILLHRTDHFSVICLTLLVLTPARAQYGTAHSIQPISYRGAPTHCMQIDSAVTCSSYKNLLERGRLTEIRHAGGGRRIGPGAARRGAPAATTHFTSICSHHCVTSTHDEFDTSARAAFPQVVGWRRACGALGARGPRHAHARSDSVVSLKGIEAGPRTGIESGPGLDSTAKPQFKLKVGSESKSRIRTVVVIGNENGRVLRTFHANKAHLQEIADSHIHQGARSVEAANTASLDGPLSCNGRGATKTLLRQPQIATDGHACQNLLFLYGGILMNTSDPGMVDRVTSDSNRPPHDVLPVAVCYGGLLSTELTSRKSESIV
ncbi:hypothetical protein EVAR_27845_1 [Eumeta japonica]|uniref:Uncharacterized protein n=1 Tax=Eumeta variegata TaxID=151549 RepID=A0A4C1VHT6_EUMVA|nr:hypothetical protein EVAR_27845_1 [Eumeta japonica]